MCDCDVLAASQEKSILESGANSGYIENPRRAKQKVKVIKNSKLIFYTAPMVKSNLQLPTSARYFVGVEIYS